VHVCRLVNIGIKMWLLVSGNCIESSGFGLCVYLGVKKHRRVPKAALNCSKVMGCVMFPGKWSRKQVLESDGFVL
jgi:hypothetical protein